MKDLLFVKKLYLLVFCFAKSDYVSDEECEIEHLHIYGFIQQYVEDSAIIIFLMRHMQKLCGRRQSPVMPLNHRIINCSCLIAS